jgi:hypothetical protein
VPPAIGAVTGAWRARSDGGRGEPLGVAGGVAHADLAASEVLQVVLDVQVRRR